MLIAPSILAADLADLASALRVCEEGGADLVHVDVMDGHFVPNLTFGIPVLQALSRRTKLPLDVHLMVQHPERLLAQYIGAGAQRVAVHWEAVTHLHGLLGEIRRQGARAGVAVNPATPVDLLVDCLQEADFVLIMSVNPGFGGQTFIPRTLDKIRRLRALLTAQGLDLEIEVDGGVTPTNIAALAAAGANSAVVGSAVFGSADPKATIQELRRTSG